MNRVFYFLFLSSILYAAGMHFFSPQTNPLAHLTEDLLHSAKSAVDLSIGLIGSMCFFLGLMKILERAGALDALAKALAPLMQRLFPDVPSDHPAMGAMIMNFSANILGLTNAATPFGIKAMQQLNTLNTQTGVATRSMILFLAINTSSITLLPTGVIALRAITGSSDPASILPTTLFATIISTIVGVSIAQLCAFFAKDIPEKTQATSKTSLLWRCNFLFCVIGLPALLLLFGQQLGPWVIPMLILGILSVGYWKKIDVYSAFIEGAKEGIEVAFKIIPYLVAILSAIACFRSSGAMDALFTIFQPIEQYFGIPEVVGPLFLIRPLSGSGAFGYLASILENPAYGPDSLAGLLASTIQGSTETTFYVIAVYFGAAQIKKLRYALIPALAADLAGFVAAVWIVMHYYAVG